MSVIEQFSHRHTEVQMYNSDNYGYYVYKNQKFYSKYDIITKAEHLSEVTWIYNDEYFSSFDWTKEPVNSLPDLYAARARKLREQYDYIILMYSGGADSFNILNTFINYDIKIDEVAHLINYEGSKDKNNHLNKEVFYVSKPKVDALIKEKNLSTTSRIIDITNRVISYFNSKTKFDFIHAINSYGSPHLFARTKLYLEVDVWKKLVSSGKKVCFIWGSDKPKVNYQDGKYFFRFVDGGVHGSIPPEDQLVENGAPTNELFYWAPTFESTQIMIKQAHLIKNYFSVESNLEYLKTIRYLENEEICGRYMKENSKQIMLGGELLKKIIYPNWDPSDNLKLKSPTGTLLNIGSEWFWGNNDNSSSKIYLNGIAHVLHSMRPCWKDGFIVQHNKLFPRKIKPIFSKNYCL